MHTAEKQQRRPDVDPGIGQSEPMNDLEPDPPQGLALAQRLAQVREGLCIVMANIPAPIATHLEAESREEKQEQKDDKVNPTARPPLAHQGPAQQKKSVGESQVEEHFKPP